APALPHGPGDGPGQAIHFTVLRLSRRHPEPPAEESGGRVVAVPADKVAQVPGPCCGAVRQQSRSPCATGTTRGARPRLPADPHPSGPAPPGPDRHAPGDRGDAGTTTRSGDAPRAAPR